MKFSTLARLRGAFLLLCAALFVLPAPAGAARQEVPLTQWKFAPAPGKTGPEQAAMDDSRWQSVTLPHTWNSKTQTQTHRAAWYRTHFSLTNADAHQEIFACFDGAGTAADVYVNGIYLGTHRGAYTRFVFDATRAVHFGGGNVLAVRCDTDPKDTSDCLPAGDGLQLYHVPGGLYRPVHLLETDPVHIDPTDCAASGVFLTPLAVTKDSATLEVKTLVRNDRIYPAVVTWSSSIESQDGKQDGKIVAVVSGQTTLPAQTSGSVNRPVQIARPHLWSTTDPYLYTVTTTVSVEGLVTDTVTEHTGFRFFQMTPTEFFLNGVPTPLRGVAKHQETEEHGCAVTDTDLRRDWDDLRELGVNYVRLAHYPHAKLEYDLADALGIVVWAENGHSNPAPPTETGRQITREMVLQNYNHPSICFWSIGNEAIKTLADIATLEDYARVARAEDPARLISYASNTAFHESYALDFVAVNRYNGWYGGTIAGFDAHAAFYHSISETGAGGVVSIHSAAARPTHRVNKYEPEEYQQEVAEARCETVFRTLSDQIPLFTWWTFRDFSDPRYKGVNTKGMETFGGFRKDIWYLYQSFLKPQTPVVYLCGKTWFLRRALPPQTYQVKAYSNAPALTLTVNGAVIGTQSNGEYVLPNNTFSNNVFVWNNALMPGRNFVTISDGAGHSDTATIYAETGEENGLVRGLQSSNPANPAYFIAEPIQPERPFYDNFDGTGDNTFHDIPALLQGASWITLGRPAGPDAQAALSFTLAPNSGQTDIFLMLTAPARIPAGWAATGVTGTWLDNALNLVPYALYKRTVRAGEAMSVPPPATDYVILLKPHAGVSGAEP